MALAVACIGASTAAPLPAAVWGYIDADGKAHVATEKLDEAYDIELVEMHHHHKKDAPSGTAEKLLEILKHGRGYGDDALRHGRSGITGARPKREIGVHALRGGDVIGDHTVIFAGDGERVELTHKASNRAIFATGSVRAAQWAATAKPGLYGMEDVLGLRYQAGRVKREWRRVKTHIPPHSHHTLPQHSLFKLHPSLFGS